MKIHIWERAKIPLSLHFTLIYPILAGEPFIEQKATHKSKSTPKSDKVKVRSKKIDRDISIDSEQQALMLPADLSLQEDILDDKALSAVEVEDKNVGFQSKGSIGLPKRKSRSR